MMLEYIYQEVIFFHAVQILNKKPQFIQDAFRLFSLKTFSTGHRSIL